MKFYRRLRIREPGFPPGLYREIAAIFPQGRKKDDFVIEHSPEDDPSYVTTIDRIVGLCERQGIRRTVQGEAGSYGYLLTRLYEPEDIEAAPLLALRTQRQMLRGDFKRDVEGRLVLPAAQAKPALKFASLFLTNWIVVSDSVRRVLTSGSLLGMEFRETVLEGKAKGFETALWELSSPLALPKLKNSRLNEHSVIPCHMIDDEPPFSPGEPHYRLQDIRGVGEFDIARTLENFGSQPMLIISQAFFRFCLENEIDLEVRPVRVDPD